jgi:hypothetical protein
MSYLYAATSQKATAVTNSLVCNFTGPNEKNLILSKGNHLEVHILKDEKLLPLLDTSLFARIKSMDFYRPHGYLQDVIFILTERKSFLVLSYDASNKRIVTRATGCMKDRVGHEFDGGMKSFIEPDNRAIAMMLYGGQIKVRGSS